MKTATSQSKSASPVLPELNEFYRLTNEDHMIFRRLKRLTRGAVILHANDRQADCHRADRRDAINMAQREIEKHRSIFSWEAWATHRREWFPSSWGLPFDERVNPRTAVRS